MTHRFAWFHRGGRWVKPMPLVAMVLLLIAASRGQGDHTVSTDSSGVMLSSGARTRADRCAIGGASRKGTLGESGASAFYGRPLARSDRTLDISPHHPGSRPRSAAELSHS